MKDFITKKHKHLLYKDECGDQFLLTGFAEIYEYDQNTLRVLCWSSDKLSKINGIMLGEPFMIETGLHRFDIAEKNLPILLQMDKSIRRRDLHGKWMESRRKLLAHQIIPANMDWDS